MGLGEQYELEKTGNITPEAKPQPPAPTADELLKRAHEMLGRAHIMLDGWQQAIDWHKDYEQYKAQSGQTTGNAPHPELIGPGICDGCGEQVSQLMVINQRGGRGVTAISGLCACQKCSVNCWPAVNQS